jgi:hypothetical protein
MAVTHNETIVRSLLAAFNAGDVEATIAFYTRR